MMDELDPQEEKEVAVLLGAALIVLLFAYGWHVQRRPIRRFDGEVQQLHVDHIPEGRKDFTREFAWDERVDGPYPGSHKPTD